MVNKPKVKETTAVRRCFIDIEVAPNVVLSWGIGRKVFLGHDAIVDERKIICVCWNWDGESKVHSLQWDHNQDDRLLLEELAEVIADADEIVAHFGKGFDWPWIKTRMVILGLPPIPDVKIVDTKSWASNNFYFNSAKLDYLAKVLGYGGKLHTDYQLWKDIVLHRSERALDYMVKYCKIDIVRLKQVYHRLKPWVQSPTHAGVSMGLAKWSCPQTGSEDVIVSKKRVTSTGYVKWQMQSKANGSYFTISDAAHRDYLEAKKKNGQKQ